MNESIVHHPPFRFVALVPVGNRSYSTLVEATASAPDVLCAVGEYAIVDAAGFVVEYVARVKGLALGRT